MANQLFVDSTAYLTKEQIDYYQIKVLSLSVNFEDETLDEYNADYDYFYKKLATVKALPKSSQPNRHAMETAFREALDQGLDIFVVTLSAEMSGTYQTVKILLDELQEQYANRQLTVVDSRSNCMQLGFQVLTVAEVFAKGLGHSDALIEVFKTQSKSRFIFFADTLTYLEKGGRIGKGNALMGNLLSVKPILTVQDGKTDAIGKVRTRHKAIQAVAKKVTEDVDQHGFVRACIHHIDNFEGVAELIEALPAFIAEDIPVVSIGPVIGTHVGPGAVGIVYQTESRL